MTLLNGRITKKTYKKWKTVNNFSLSIFQKINLCLPANNESQRYLKKLGAKNIKQIGNLKYSQSENDKIEINKNLKRFISSKKIWCASSTHSSEEIFCGIVHKELKKKFPH